MAITARGRGGFTLVEMLAALAIAAMVVVSTGALIRQGVFFFDRGTRTVDADEQLALAIDCLTRDFGAMRFVLQKTEGSGGMRISFTDSAEDENGITFLSAGGRAVGPQGEEIVSLTIETNADGTQLVRRRAPWLGPRMHLRDAQLEDPVVLLKGHVSLSFSFSKLGQNGTAEWVDHWTDDKSLPHAVRLTIHDEATGIDLPGTVFAVHADAPAACATGRADCLARPADTAPRQQAAPGRQ
jgi:type II secretion system protein J